MKKIYVLVLAIGMVSQAALARDCHSGPQNRPNEVEFTGFTAGGSLASGSPNFHALVTMGTYSLGCDHLGIMAEAGTIRQLPGDTPGFGALNAMLASPLRKLQNNFVFATAGLNFAHTLNFGVGWDHAVHHARNYDTAWRFEVRNYYDYSRNDHNLAFRIAYLPGFSKP